MSYAPDWLPHASCASQHHLYALDVSWDKQHIHSLLPGLHYIGCVTTQQMGLGPQDRIWRVVYGDGDFLHLWVDNKRTGKDNRLMAYKVSGS